MLKYVTEYKILHKVIRQKCKQAKEELLNEKCVEIEILRIEFNKNLDCCEVTRRMENKAVDRLLVVAPKEEVVEICDQAHPEGTCHIRATEFVSKFHSH